MVALWDFLREMEGSTDRGSTTYWVDTFTNYMVCGHKWHTTGHPTPHAHIVAHTILHTHYTHYTHYTHIQSTSLQFVGH